MPPVQQSKTPGGNRPLGSTPPPPPVEEKKEEAPAKVLPVLPPNPTKEDKEKFLTSRGWAHVGYNGRREPLWRDENPAPKPKKTVTSTLKTLSGGQEAVKQTIGPPVPFPFPLEEAVLIVQQREVKLTPAAQQ